MSSFAVLGGVLVRQDEPDHTRLPERAKEGGVLLPQAFGGPQRPFGGFAQTGRYRYRRL
jgi:hypothetical protein